MVINLFKQQKKYPFIYYLFSFYLSISVQTKQRPLNYGMSIFLFLQNIRF